MELFLFFQAHHGSDHNGPDGLNLEDVWNDSETGTEKEIFQALVAEVAAYAIEEEVPFGEVTGLTVDDENGEELAISSEEYDSEWIRKVAKLVFHVYSSGKHRMPTEALLGYIEDQHWEYFDFDNGFTSAEDTFVQEYDGDAAEFAREYMDGTDQGIPDHLESHFDYDSYGEELLDDYTKVSWRYTEYLFSE